MEDASEVEFARSFLKRLEREPLRPTPSSASPNPQPPTPAQAAPKPASPSPAAAPASAAASEVTMSVRVMPGNGLEKNTLNLTLPPSSTGSDLRSMLSSSLGVAGDRLRIVHAGKALADTQSLAALSDKTVHVLGKPQPAAEAPVAQAPLVPAKEDFWVTLRQALVEANFTKEQQDEYIENVEPRWQGIVLMANLDSIEKFFASTD